MNSSYGLDAYSPREIAERVHEACLTKARLSFLQLAMPGMLAGAFIGLGAFEHSIANMYIDRPDERDTAVLFL